MLRPDKMLGVDILLLQQDIEIYSRELIRSGLFHIVDFNKFSDNKLSKRLKITPSDSTVYSTLWNRIEKMNLVLNIDLQFSDDTKILSENELNQKLDEMDRVCQDFEINLRNINEKLEGLKAAREQLLPIRNIKLSLSEFNIKTRYLYIKTGSINIKKYESFKNQLKNLVHIIIPLKEDNDKSIFIIMVLASDQALLDKILNSFNFRNITFDSINEKEHSPLSFLKKIDEQTDILINKKKELTQSIEEKRKSFTDDYLNLAFSIKLYQLVNHIKKNTMHSSSFYIVGGFIKAAEKEKLINLSNKVLGEKYKIEFIEPEQVDGVRSGKLKIPVSTGNPLFFKPFEMLIDNYGTPEYGTVEPTIFFAFSFLLMFGAMFGDVGHGLVLFLTGFVLCKKYKKTPQILKFSAILKYAGFLSMIFGFLYGSFFGFEHIIPALWLKPINNIILLLKYAVFLGIFIISTGIILNIYSLISTSNYVEALFNKAGIISGIMYWSSIFIVLRIVEGHKLNNLSLTLIGLILLSSILLFLKPLFSKLIFVQSFDKNKESKFTVIIETIMELYEIFLGYIANTLSFIRVAAFTLSHTGILIAIMTLSELVSETPVSVVGSAFIIVVGNIFVILLEGLVVGIQCVRLNYYEFFSKFFRGGGEKFNPININGGEK